MKSSTSAFATWISIMTLIVAGTASGASAEPSVSSSLITWEASPGHHLTLDVSDAGRYEFAPGESPSLTLHDAAGAPLADGTYTWRLTAAPVLSEKETEARRKGDFASVPMGYTESGAFSIRSGAFVDPTLPEVVAEKDHVIDEELIVTSEACFGRDCSENDLISLQTIWLKENNTRIRFQDTSSEGFPGTDWELVANEFANGGLNKFSIDDLTNHTTPFTVEGGAPDHTIYGQADGDVGVGVNDPQQRLHLLEGDSPAIRLEQDGSSGFVPQTWDLVGNEQNYLIRDVTNNTYPLRIQAGAPNDVIYVASSGSVGIGTDEPARPIHIQADSSAHIAFEHTASSNRWNVGANSGAFVISLNNSGSRELEIKETGDIYFRFGSQELAKLDKDGNLNITGTLTTGGTGCGGGCDLVFQPGYELETIEEHAEFMWKNSYLPAVGPTVENGEAWNLTAMTGGMLNELEKAHIYIEQLHDHVGQLKADRQAKDDEIDDLKKRLARLEALVLGE